MAQQIERLEVASFIVVRSKWPGARLILPLDADNASVHFARDLSLGRTADPNRPNFCANVPLRLGLRIGANGALHLPYDARAAPILQRELRLDLRKHSRIARIVLAINLVILVEILTGIYINTLIFRKACHRGANRSWRGGNQSIAVAVYDDHILKVPVFSRSVPRIAPVPPIIPLTLTLIVCVRVILFSVPSLPLGSKKFSGLLLT